MAADVLSGKTFTNSTSSGINGSMTNQGTKTYTINPGGSQTIPAGYHNGSGKVTANANQNSGTYTFASESTGATVDMGVNNTYRYVNATNVYNKGKADGSTAIMPVGKCLYFYGAGQGAVSCRLVDLQKSSSNIYEVYAGSYLVDIKNNNLTKVYFQCQTGSIGTQRGIMLINGNTITPYYTTVGGSSFSNASLTGYSYLSVTATPAYTYGMNFYVT